LKKEYASLDASFFSSSAFSSLAMTLSAPIDFEKDLIPLSSILLIVVLILSSSRSISGVSFFSILSVKCSR